MTATIIVVAALSFAHPALEAHPVTETAVTSEVRLAQASLRTKIRRSKCQWMRDVQGKRCWPHPGSHPPRRSRSSAGRTETATTYADPQIKPRHPSQNNPKRVRVPTAEPVATVERAGPVTQRPQTALEPTDASPAKAEQPQSFWAWVMSFLL
ncbi:MAG: hypothetical protein AAFP67_08605 [Pseudomonadota bacterium]